MVGTTSNKPMGMTRKGATGWIGRSFCQDNAQAHEGIKGGRTHALHTVGEEHKPRTRSRMRQGKNGRNDVGVKEDKRRGQWKSHKGRSTTYLYLTNTGEVDHWSRDSEGVVWWWEENGFILGFLLRLLLGKMPCWDDISPKRGKQCVRAT